jgi:phospholipid/cholesterol/gamma-HCH transport system ATP-binding protein
MIILDKISKSFGSRKVLDDVSLTIREGESVFILGKSGVGKSVLLKHIVGLVSPDSGTVEVADRKVNPSNANELALIRQTCGLVFQFPALLDSVTVFENVCFGLRARDLTLSETEIEQRVKEKVKLVGLSEKVLTKYPGVLSFGAQKRVSIARTLAVAPRYLLFDEPTTGMDPIATTGLNQLIRKLTSELKVTTVVVSHDVKSALKIGSRIILLEEGKIVFDGTPEEFRTSKVKLAMEFQLGTQYEF